MVRISVSFNEHELTKPQGSFHLSATILDNDHWSVDTLENSTHQRRSLLGMADQACDHCWVCCPRC